MPESDFGVPEDVAVCAGAARASLLQLTRIQPVLAVPGTFIGLGQRRASDHRLEPCASAYQRCRVSSVYSDAAHSGLPLGNQVLQRYSLRKVSTLIRYGTFSSIVATTKCRGYRVDKHIEMGPLGRRCWQKVVRYGFKNEIDLPRGLEHVRSWGCQMEPVTTRYFSSRDVVIPTSGTGMAS